jgi:hypothetical protein
MGTMKHIRVFIIFAGIAVMFVSLVPVVAAAGFARDLFFGLRNDPEVVRLQDFLRGQKFFTFPQSTGNFLGVTLDAVKRFQTAYGILPAAGYFGPRSRVVANQVLAGIPASSPAPPPLSGAGGCPSCVPSPYKGKIKIASLSGTGKTPESEQIMVVNKSTIETISITGFSVENSRGGRFDIPKGHELPGSSAAMNDPIRLRPGDQAVITLGKQERQMNFRENLCTGYLDEFSKFSPSLSRRCPRVNPREFPQLSDRCITKLGWAASCRMMKQDEFTDAGCIAFAQEHLNYAGCVRDHREQPDFYAKRWLIWMQRPTEFFRNTVERVVLKDQQGRLVDERSY